MTTSALRRAAAATLAFALACAGPALAQAPASPTPPPPAPASPTPPSPPPPLESPEVLADARVTFRLRSPGAKQVSLALEGADPAAMQKDVEGVWSLTTSPLEPDYYGYSFVIDGVTSMDPSNHAVKPNFLYRASEVHVPGKALPWDVADVPRGRLHRHFYRSAVVGDQRDFYVYTPPGYEAATSRYPVLYLLHGFSDDASGWTAVGRAHVILDNLIAQGKAKPMLVVMPLGYGAPEILTLGIGNPRSAEARERNVSKLREALFTEMMPEIERVYRVAPGREARAIVGLSMGGGQSLQIGLANLDRFAWVGAFSSAVPEAYDTVFSSLDEKTNARLRLLWIGVGSGDFLIAVNRKFHGWLDERKVRHTWVETPGGRHTWMVWRRYLAELAPLLFR